MTGRARRAVAALAAVSALLLAGAAAPAFAYEPPAATYGVETEEMFVEMDDGVRLAGTVAYPTLPDGSRATGRPAIVTMTPYGKDISGPGSFWPARGFIQAVFDIRGAGASHGTLDENYFSPRESRDSATVIDHIGGLPEADCRVGMAGGSYLGITQYMAAGEQPDCLKAIVPSVAASDLYREAAYHGGMLSQFFGAQYLVLQQNGTGLVSGPAEPNEPADALVAKTEQLQSDSIAWDYLANTTYNDFYRDRSPIELADRIEVPALIYDGWFDGFIRGAQEMYWALEDRPVETRLWIDPVTHKGGRGYPFNPQGYAGALDSFTNAQLEFLDRHLNGAATPDRPPVKLYMMGEDTYLEDNSYPPAEVEHRRYWLGDGEIAEAPPADGAGSYLTNPLDGWTNTLSRHGVVAVSPYLPFDQSLESEQGLVWSTPVLEEPQRLAGPLSLSLVAQTTAPDTDWVVRVSDVDPSGTATLVTEGYLRASHRELDAARSRPGRPYHPHTGTEPVPAGEWVPYEIEVWPTAIELAPGHRLQVQLTSNDTPNHTPGTVQVDKDDPSRVDVRPHQPALNTVRYGADGSSLVLPVLP